MKYLKIISFLMLIAYLPLSAASSLSAEAATWAEISPWVGQYPVNKAAKDLFKLPTVKRALDSLLDATDRKLLSAYTVSTPIEADGDFITIEKCRPHNCPAERVLVVFDSKSNRLWIGFFERKKDRVSSRWFGNEDDFSVLTETVRAKLPK